MLTRWLYVTITPKAFLRAENKDQIVWHFPNSVTIKAKCQGRESGGKEEVQMEPATELDNLSLIPRTHMGEGESPSKLSSGCHKYTMSHIYKHTLIHTYEI